MNTEARQIAEGMLKVAIPADYAKLARAYLALEARCAALEELLRFARRSKAFSVSLNRDESGDELNARLQSILDWTDKVDAAVNGGQG